MGHVEETLNLAPTSEALERSLDCHANAEGLKAGEFVTGVFKGFPTQH